MMFPDSDWFSQLNVPEFVLSKIKLENRRLVASIEINLDYLQRTVIMITPKLKHRENEARDDSTGPGE